MKAKKTDNAIQKVQKQKPEAVITHGSGYLMVDYGKL